MKQHIERVNFLCKIQLGPPYTEDWKKLKKDKHRIIREWGRFCSPKLRRRFLDNPERDRPNICASSKAHSAVTAHRSSFVAGRRKRERSVGEISDEILDFWQRIEQLARSLGLCPRPRRQKERGKDASNRSNNYFFPPFSWAITEPRNEVCIRLQENSVLPCLALA